jgi:hypothetical protein
LCFDSTSAYAATDCPIADRFLREAEIFEIGCDYRQNVVAALESQLNEVTGDVDESGGTGTKIGRVYSAEQRALTNRIKVAQRAANVACSAVDLRLRSAERATSTCNRNAAVLND